ncbi:hypothetical protein HGA34_05630 [Candidatus Falkowbacteria bacterium]|nr:hypothetical protein [Candidatus Falkowbacteria bacterium]
MYVLGLCQGRNCHVAVSMDKYKAQALKAVKKVISQESSLAGLRSAYDKNAAEAQELYDQTIGRTSFRGFTTPELKKTIKETADLMSRIIKDSVYIEVFDKDILIEAADKETVGAILSVWEEVTSPTFATFEHRHNAYIIKTVETHGLEKSVDLAKYIFTDYFSVQDDGQAMEMIGEVFKNKTSALKEAEAQLESARENQRRISELTVGFSASSKLLVGYVSLVMELRDLRKDPLAQAQTVIYSCARELLDRLGLGEISASGFLPHELAMFDETAVSAIKESALKRAKGFAYLVRPDNSASCAAVEFAPALQELNALVFDQGDEVIEIKGSPASRGIAKGRVRIVIDAQAAVFEDGEILVTGMTRPEFVPLMKRAAAIITNEGGITCHAAIVSRELGIPCVIGTKIATRALKDGDLVEVDANAGVIKILN